jgi:hypothetical protein
MPLLHSADVYRMLNGSVLAANLFAEAVLKGQPIILFKYTGYTTDLACEMLEKADKLVKARRKKPSSIPERPFADDLKPGDYHNGWLSPFNAEHVSDCNKMNVAIENFPHRFDPSSVFIVDLFHTSGDELQDKITQTMAVVFSPPHELGKQGQGRPAGGVLCFMLVYMPIGFTFSMLCYAMLCYTILCYTIL